MKYPCLPKSQSQLTKLDKPKTIKKQTIYTNEISQRRLPYIISNYFI